MNRVLLSISSAALLATAIQAPDQPKFAVEEKATLTKSFESTAHLASTSFKIMIEGHDDPLPDVGEVEFTLDNAEKVEVTDEYVAVGKGRPARLKRTFDKLAGTATQHAKGPGGEEAPAEDDKEESDLEGKSVLFAWNEDASRFDASFAEGKGDDALLEDLTEDMDFRALLPKAKVADGDTWDLEAKAFDGVLAPGGDLKLEGAKKEGDDDESGKIDKELRKNLAGKGKATWKGVREEDGHKVGVIEVTADLTSEGEVVSGAEHSGKAGFKTSMDLEGELLWDLAGGHFRSFQLTGKTQFSLTTTESMDFDGKQIAMRQVIEFDGEMTLHAMAK